jgi:hypothetical protein
MPGNAMINVIVPTPVPAHEVLDVPELHVPTHTGAAPVVYQVPIFSTPIPDAHPGDYIVLSTTVVGGRIDGQVIQGAAIEAGLYDAHDGTIKTLDELWEQAKSEITAETGATSGATYGTNTHTRWGELIEAAQAAGTLPADIKIEDSVLAGGDDAKWGQAGSIRRDVVIEIGDTLVILPDGKTGQADLTPARIDRLISSVRDKVKHVVVMLVK